MRVSVFCGASPLQKKVMPWKGSLFVAMHRRFMLGISHGRVNEERQEDDAGEIIVKPFLMAHFLEIERNRGRGAAENRDRDRIRQADAHRANLGRKQLC